MKLKLVRLTHEYKSQLTDMMTEWTASGETIVPYSIRKNDFHDFDAYLAGLNESDPAPGKVPGIDRVLMTCDDGNIGSAKSIENNGGILENKLESDGTLIRRYWINL